MPGTADDFMRRFGGGSATDDHEAPSIMTALRPPTPMIGSLTPRRCRRAPRNTSANYRTSTSSKAAHQAFAQAPPRSGRGG